MRQAAANAGRREAFPIDTDSSRCCDAASLSGGEFGTNEVEANVERTTNRRGARKAARACFAQVLSREPAGEPGRDGGVQHGPLLECLAGPGEGHWGTRRVDARLVRGSPGPGRGTSRAHRIRPNGYRPDGERSSSPPRSPMQAADVYVYVPKVNQELKSSRVHVRLERRYTFR